MSNDHQLFRVVVNHEEQYSIWAVDTPIPAGWREEGTSGSREICLTRIKEVWTDMRPLSLRVAMDGAKMNQPVAASE